uniref:RNA polymerase sigma factor n=1 Tax=Schlesneria paludicola TaxID=360056 RepID=A0A7C2PG34_9PLAN
MPDSDEILMRLAQEGRTDAFEELVRRYRGALLRVAWSKLGDAAAAEDVVQEALLAAYAARHTFNPQFAFRTWLWTIALRLCQRQWKRVKSPSQNGGMIEPAQVDSLPGLAETGLDQLLRSERVDVLHRALNALPEPQADALRLRFFGGLPYEDIAAAMQSSVSGAKQRVKLGLERLAVQLRQWSGTES